jgi:hypothetical protein
LRFVRRFVGLDLPAGQPIAGLGGNDLEALTVALRLAECHYSDGYGASGLSSAIHCAVEAKCYEDSASYFLSTLQELQLRVAIQQPGQQRMQRGALAEQVLGIVEHQQHGAIADVLGDLLDRIAPWSRLQSVRLKR